MPPPWKHSRPGWKRFWATWSGGRCPCSWQRSWNWMICKVPSNPKRSMMLWFRRNMCQAAKHLKGAFTSDVVQYFYVQWIISFQPNSQHSVCSSQKPPAQLATVTLPRTMGRAVNNPTAKFWMNSVCIRLCNSTAKHRSARERAQCGRQTWHDNVFAVTNVLEMEPGHRHWIAIEKFPKFGDISISLSFQNFLKLQCPNIFWFLQHMLEEGERRTFFPGFATRPLTKPSYAFSFHNADVGSWHACGVGWEDSPLATEVLSHHVFAPLKFLSARAEIWSVKNCRFPPPSCVPEGDFGRRPKPIESKNPVAERHSGNRLCWECLGLPGRGAAALVPLPSSPAPTVQGFSLCHPESNHGVRDLGLLGRRSQRPVAQHWGMAGQGREREQRAGQVCPPHVDRRHPENRATPPLRSISSTGKPDRLCSGSTLCCFRAEVLMEGRCAVALMRTKKLCWGKNEHNSKKKKSL